MNYLRLTKDDTSLVGELMRVFAAAFEDEKMYLSSTPDVTYTKRLLDNPSNIVLVAISDEGVVVGGLVAYELQKFEQETSEIYLYDLAVDAAYRRRGIATSLISHLKITGRECGASVLFVQADNVDKPALALYKKLASSVDREVTHFDISVE